MSKTCLAVLALVFVLGLSHTVMAKPDHAKAKGNKHQYHEESEAEAALISSSDLALIRNFLAQEYPVKLCPPGLAKKHNGCLPPGQAKKYRIGQPAPADLALIALPQDLLLRLHPPAGYFYARVDQDVVLVAEASKKIIDAITLLSALQ